MKLLLISTPDFFDHEINQLVELFLHERFTYHLRKPLASENQLIAFIEKIPEIFHPRMVLHQCHSLKNRFDIQGLHFNEKIRSTLAPGAIQRLKEENPSLSLSTSYHDLQSMMESGHLFDYVLISPVFDSISKPGYKKNIHPALAKEAIEAIRKIHPDFSAAALGGITPEKLPLLNSAGFDFAAVLGGVWGKNPLLQMREYIKILHQL